jgi:hypothetical protein
MIKRRHLPSNTKYGPVIDLTYEVKTLPHPDVVGNRRITSYSYLSFKVKQSVYRPYGTITTAIRNGLGYD